MFSFLFGFGWYNGKKGVSLWVDLTERLPSSPAARRVSAGPSQRRSGARARRSTSSTYNRAIGSWATWRIPCRKTWAGKGRKNFPASLKKYLQFYFSCANIFKLSIINDRYAPLAQLDRASGYGPEGQGFESLTACQNPDTPHGVSGFLYICERHRTPDLKTRSVF